MKSTTWLLGAMAAMTMSMTALAGCASNADAADDESEIVDNATADIVGSDESARHRPKTNGLEYMSIVVGLAQYEQKLSGSANPLQTLTVAQNDAANFQVEKGWAYVEATPHYKNPGNGQIFALLSYEEKDAAWKVVEVTEGSELPLSIIKTWATKHPAAKNIVRKSF